jgi:hypothetical protein
MKDRIFSAVVVLPYSPMSLRYNFARHGIADLQHALGCADRRITEEDAESLAARWHRTQPLILLEAPSLIAP